MVVGILGVAAGQDGAGDGWVELHLKGGGGVAPFVGFHIGRLLACGSQRPACVEIAVFGGSGGAAEASGLLVSAGHAFVHGVFGACLSPSCRPIAPPSAAADSLLLTTLSVALPREARLIETVCLENAVLHAGAATSHMASACAPVTLVRGIGPNATFSHRAGAASFRRTGVALVKTYKTGSSTLASLLHRYADTRGLDVAVNAKALKYTRGLEPRLRPGTMPKPTECLYEFHTFKPCGKEWIEAQAKASLPLAPKPLQLVIDHSRWQPLTELLKSSSPSVFGGGASSSASGVPQCASFLLRMKRSSGIVHGLFAGGHASAASADLAACVRGIVGEQHAAGGRSLAAPTAYREAVPNGLLVTLMRWPPSRFTSAVEQFDIPQQTGVPCRRNRRRTGGRCFGQTCERDFKFSWACMNRTVHRTGMLATFVRCLMAEPSRAAPTRAAQATRRAADLDAIAAASKPPSRAHERAFQALRARLAADAARGDAPSGCDTAAPVGGRQRSVRDLPSSFRYVQESVANTLGWPLNPRPRADDYDRMLKTDATFARLALDWLGALSRSLDVVLISEHYDESLLLLARKLHVSPMELMYLSQKRRKQSAAASSAMHTPAARAALSSLAVGNVTAWPEVAQLDDPDGPWLWPNELDTVLRANWLDSLAYMLFNATLWSQIHEQWPGATGEQSLQSELTNFRATRLSVKSGCTRCEALGAGECLRAARASASVPPPHLCWSLRQDTRSWSEHFFRRMALRFDAAAAASSSATAPPTLMGGLAHRRAARGDVDGAGVTTGNVHWWRCPEGRAVESRCSRLKAASYSLSECACSWREGRAG